MKPRAAKLNELPAPSLRMRVLGADAEVADLVAGPAFVRERRAGIDAAAFRIGVEQLLVVAVDALDEVPGAEDVQPVGQAIRHVRREVGDVHLALRRVERVALHRAAVLLLAVGVCYRKPPQTGVTVGRGRYAATLFVLRGRLLSRCGQSRGNRDRSSPTINQIFALILISSPSCATRASAGATTNDVPQSGLGRGPEADGLALADRLAFA